MAYSYGPTIVKNGLVLAYDAANPRSYPGSGDLWTDLSGNRNSGSIKNGPVFSTSNGGIFTFDGSDDYVDPIFNNGGEIPKITVNTWIRVSSFSTGWFNQTVINSWFGRWQLEIRNSDRIPFFFVSSGSNPVISEVVLGQTPLSASQWYMLTGTFGSGLDLYLNGALNQTTASVPFEFLPPVSSYVSGFIAASWRRRGNPFLGDIAQIQVYNRGLSPSEVLQNYKASKGRYGLK